MDEELYRLRCVHFVCVRLALLIWILHLAVSVGGTTIWNLLVLAAILRALQSWT